VLRELYKDQDRTRTSITYIRRLAVIIGVESVARQTEVGDFNDKVLGDENIPRSQVAVNTLYNIQTRSIIHTYLSAQ